MHTHRLTIAADVVRKQFVSWEDDEADREWSGLTTLAEHAPGLAPEPISRGSDGDAPVVVMSRVPGAPLGSDPVTPAQIDALANGPACRLVDHQYARLDAYRRLLATFWLAMLLPGNCGFERTPAGSAEDQARYVLTLLGEAR